jgi:hypothetical protein
MKVEIYVPLYKEETDAQKYLLSVSMVCLKNQQVKDYELEVVCGYESITPQTSIRLCESLGFKLEECPRDYITPGSPAGKYAYRYAKSKADFFSTCQNDDFFYVGKTISQLNCMKGGNYAISIVGHTTMNHGVPIGFDNIHYDNEGIAGSVPSCWMINKSIVPEFPLEYTGMFNWDNIALYKIATYGRLLSIPIPLVIYNLHEDCTSLKYKDKNNSVIIKRSFFDKYKDKIVVDVMQ